MNEEQQAGYIAFIANFVALLHEEHIEARQALQLAGMAASALLGAVLHVDPQDETAKTFAIAVVSASIKKFYGVTGK